MADEVIESGEGQEVTQESHSTDAAAEAAVESKMADIFGANAERDEANGHLEEGIVSDDNPDGDGQPVAEHVDEVPGEDTVGFEDATVEELKAAEKEAAANGDYDRASELRAAAKTRETQLSAASKNQSKPDATRTSLLKYASDLGLSADKDIADLVQENPVLARITLNRIADGYNATSLQFAQAARQNQQATQPNATTQQQNSALDALYKDLNGFAEVAGSEVVERFIKPLKNEVLEPLRDVINFVNQQRAESVRREVLTGFEAVSKDGFENHYGKVDSLTDAQRTARQQVAQVADMIHVGASKQNINMSYAEAIRRAHVVVNADKMQQQNRTQILKDVKKRSTQIVQRPTNRVARSAKTGDEAALAAAANFWAKQE